MLLNKETKSDLLDMDQIKVMHAQILNLKSLKMKVS